MEIKIACTACGYSFIANPDKEEATWLKCPKCEKGMSFADAIRPLLQEQADDPEFTIECGTLSAYHGYSRSVRLPSSISIIDGGYRDDGSHYFDSFSEKMVCKGVFEDSAIEEIELSTSIRVIRDYAFANCKNLRRVILPEGLVYIGRGAFEKCDSLTEVRIPITCTHIGDLCFSECKSLRWVTIINNISEYSWGEYPYGASDDYKPSATTRKHISIGQGAFYNCESLQSISFPDSMYEIPGYCFYGCKSLRSFDIPSNVSFVYDNAFNGCEELRELHLPEDNGKDHFYLYASCFKGMKSLSRINIPELATFPYSRDGRAFEGCTSLSSVTISDVKLERSIREFEGTPFYKIGQRRLFEKEVPEKKELDEIKRELRSIWSELDDLQDRLGKLGFFDMSEKSSLKSKISSLTSRENSLYRRGQEIDRDLPRKLKSLCYKYDMSYEEEFCKRSSDSWYADYTYYSFHNWYMESRYR